MPHKNALESDKTLDQQIAEIDAEIEDCKRKIAAARQRRTTLVQKKKEIDMSELLDALIKSGKTPEELLSLLKVQIGE